jgi:RNA polymerase sigma-70 factor (ECF subfamily)
MAANPQWQNEADEGGLSSVTEMDSDAAWDKRVMDRICVGDEEAMALLYDRYSRLVFSVSIHVLRDQDIAEDLTQDVFLRIWRTPHSFTSSRGRLASWLAVMTRHRAIDILRKQRKEILTVIAEPSDRSFQNRIEISEAAGKVAAILPSMPAAQREALGLAYFSGLSHSEISAKTGEPLGTIKSRIRLALDFLRKGMANTKTLCTVPATPTNPSKRK